MLQELYYSNNIARQFVHKYEGTADSSEQAGKQRL